jgi:hypothetical protein
MLTERGVLVTGGIPCRHCLGHEAKVGQRWTTIGMKGRRRADVRNRRYTRPRAGR